MVVVAEPPDKIGGVVEFGFKGPSSHFIALGPDKSQRPTPGKLLPDRTPDLPFIEEDVRLAGMGRLKKEHKRFVSGLPSKNLPVLVGEGEIR